MVKAIIPKGSQGSLIVNFANIISIFEVEDKFENTETHIAEQGYGVVAEVVDNEEVTILGVYKTGLEMEQAMAALIRWLESDSNVFRMPE